MSYADDNPLLVVQGKEVEKTAPADTATAPLLQSEENVCDHASQKAASTEAPTTTRDSVHAERAKYVLRTASVVTSGSFIPMFTDKVRNNVRSRPILIGLYSVSTAFVCLLIILAISLNKNAAWTYKFATPPPASAYLGEPISTFSFQVLDGNNKGVAGQPVYAFLIPIDSVDLVVTLDQGSVVSRTVNCIREMASVLSATFADDFTFCNPLDSGLMVNAHSVTDERGLAKFEDMTLGFGMSGAYVMTVGLQNFAGQYLTQFISFQANVASIVINKGLEPRFSFLRQGLPIVDLTNMSSLVSDTMPISVTVNFYPSLKFQASYNVDTAERLAEQAAGYFGMTIPEYIQSMADQFEPLPAFICGAIVSLDLQKGGYSNVNNVIEPLQGPAVKGLRFIGNTNCSAQVVQGNVSTSSVGGLANGEMFSVTLTFDHFGVIGSNTDQMFLGVAAMGMIIPLPLMDLTTPDQNPSQLLIASAPFTNVGSVSVTCPNCETYQFTIDEGQPITSLSVNVADGDGNPLQLRNVFMYARASFLNPNNLAEGTPALLAPCVNAKTLLLVHGTTDSSGTCDMSLARFTATGSPGLYDVFIVVDGVTGNWTNATSGAVQRFATFNVTTSVNACELSFDAGDPETVEYVGETWAVMPTVTLTDVHGELIPGKIVNLVARDATTYFTTAKSLQTNSVGIAYFVSVVVSSISNTTTTVWDALDMTPQLVTFDVVVDGVVMATFERSVAPPRNFTWALSPSAAAANHSEIGPHGSCQTVRFVSAPPKGYFGVPYPVIVRSLDALNNPVPYAVVNLTVDPKYMPPPVGMAIYMVSFMTDANGTAVVYVNINGVAPEFSFVGNMFCSDAPQTINYLSMAFISRVRKLSLACLGKNQLCLSLDVPDWSLVTPEYPITISVVPNWYPAYVINFLPTSSFPTAETVTVTSPEEALNVSVRMSSSAALTFPQGLYGFTILVDYNAFNPLILSSLVSYNMTLTLEQSMFDSTHDILHVGELMPHQPIVRIINQNTGLPIENVTVFVQACVVNPLTGARKYQAPFSDITTISFGALTMMNVTAKTVSKPASLPSDASGYAYFQELRLIGVAPAVGFSARYCVCLNALFDLSMDTPITNCVEDPNVGYLPFTEYVTFETSTQTLSGAPGLPLPPISITGTLNNGEHPPAMYCGARLIGAPSSYLQFASNLYTKYMPYGSFSTAGPTLLISNSMTLSSRVPEGTYVMVFFCVGGVTPPVSIVVTATPTRICMSLPPPTSPTVKGIIPIQVQVSSTSRIPIAYINMELSIQSTSGANCTGYQCGYLDPSSTLFASTDLTGSALFSVIFAVAPTSDFVFTFSVASSFSGTRIRQFAKVQLSEVAAMFGRPVNLVVPSLEAATSGSGIAVLLQIASSISGITATRTGTFLPSGATPVVPTTAPPLCGSSASGGAAQGGGSQGFFGDSSSSSDDGGGITDAIATYLGPLTSVIDLIARSGDSAGAVMLSLSQAVHVVNPVTTSTVLRPAALQPMELPTPVSNVVGIAVTLTVSSTLQSFAAPVIRFLNADGTPAANRSVLVECLPFSNDCAVYGSNGAAFITDDNGTVTVSPLVIDVHAVGIYQLRFSVDGGAPCLSDTFQVTQKAALSRWEYMKYLAGFLVCFFSPMLMALVPLSRKLYLPFACIIALGSVAVSVVVREFLPSSEELYVWYFWFLVALTVCLAVAVLTLAVTDVLSNFCGLHALRVTNDELRAVNVVRYTRWIMNIRIRHQTTLWNRLQDEQIRSFGNRMRLAKYRLMIKITNAINTCFGGEVLDDDKFLNKQLQRRRRVIQKELLYTESEAFDPVYVPINFLIVVGISAVLLVTLCFVIVYVYTYLLSKINLLLSYFPDVSGSKGVQLQLINKILVTVIVTTINVIVRAFPSYSNLSAFASAIKDIDIVKILSTIREYISAGLIRLEVAFWVGGSVALIVFIVTILMTYLTIPSTIRKLRRGRMPGVLQSTSIASSEGYIGMHCLQLIILHQIIFWPVALIVFLISIGPLRVFLWDQGQVIIAASIVSYLTQTLVQQIIVTKFLCRGKFTVIRPELYSIWHFAGLILGIFSGLVKSAVRYAMSLGLMTALFARLDQAIFPELFASMDKGHMGFVSIVSVEAANGNPLYLTFSTLLIMEMRLRQEAVRRAEAAAATSGGNSPSVATYACSADTATPIAIIDNQALRLPVDDTFLASEYNLSAVVKNCARIFVRENATNAQCSVDLRLPVIPTAPAAVSNSSISMAQIKGVYTDPLLAEAETKANVPPFVDLTPYLDIDRRRRQQRIRQRWWLWVILTLNPSLILERKHNLYFGDVISEEEDNNDTLQTTAEPL